MSVIFKEVGCYIAQLLLLFLVWPHIQMIGTCLLMRAYVFIDDEDILLAVAKIANFFHYPTQLGLNAILTVSFYSNK